MSNILLVSEKQIKDRSFIEDNVNGKMLSAVIAKVQDFELKAVLGKDLYTNLMAEVNRCVTETGYTLSAQYEELLTEYVRPYLIYAVLVEVLVWNNYKITNKGVMKLTDNAASSIGQGELNNVKEMYDNYMSQYKGKLINYLKEQSLNSPYADTNTESYNIGWYLEHNKVTNPYNYYENYIHRNYYCLNG